MKTRRRHRTWWTACSPHATEYDDVPSVDLATSIEEGEEIDSALGERDRVMRAHPSTFENGIVRALSRGPRTFAGIAAEVAALHPTDAIGTPLEFALWAMVEASRVKFSPEAPVVFVLWFSTRRPDFERAYDRALERRFEG